MQDPFEFVTRLHQQVGFAGLTENQKLFYAVQALYGSDFTEYFCAGLDADEDMSDEDFAAGMDVVSKEEDYALEGLKRIGAPRAARIFEKARYDGDWARRQRQFHDAEPVESLLRAFALQHSGDFGGDSRGTPH